jgi:hypothetical protein
MQHFENGNFENLLNMSDVTGIAVSITETPNRTDGPRHHNSNAVYPTIYRTNSENIILHYF